MTPPSSIMSQIVVAGMYYQNGPSGGDLTPVGDTKLLAELVDPRGETPQIKIWRPVDRNDPKSWAAVAASVVPTVNQAAAATERSSFHYEATITGTTHSLVFSDEMSRRLDLGTLGDWVVRR